MDHFIQVQWRRIKALILRRLKVNAEGKSEMALLKPFRTFTISLPADHLLLRHQSKHPNYDRFLPHLAGHLDDFDLVIDVGANVGDTLAAMYDANPRLRYVCVEPDMDFYSLLSDNIATIRAAGNPIEVETYQSLVGQAVSYASLHGGGGTKHQVPGVGMASVSLDSLIREDDHAAVRLLKTDVDGYDFDVLDSAETLISNSKPLIYFECQYETEDQLCGFLNTLENLESAGYTHWSIFDNFGSFVMQTSDRRHLIQLMQYVWAQSTGRSTRTIYYFDVLAAQDEERQFVESVLKTY